MDNRLFKCLMVVVPALMAFSGQSSEGDADSGADSYVPAAVFCANGSENLCSLMPGMIGPDPALQATEGYHGLAANVPDASQDSQSPVRQHGLADVRGSELGSRQSGRRSRHCAQG